MTVNTFCFYSHIIEVVIIKEFSQKEKDIIRKNLLDNARVAFSKAGIKKTSIEELTNSVGIAKGSFYIFFKSKEDLYFEILVKEITDSVPINEIMIKKPGQEFKQMFSEFLHQAIDSVQTNPILKLMLVPEEYKIVYRRLAANSNNHASLDIITPLTAVIKNWQAAGAVINVDAYLLANVIKCLFLLTTHQNEIGSSVFPDIMNYLIEIIVDDFTRKTGTDI